MKDFLNRHSTGVALILLGLAFCFSALALRSQVAKKEADGAQPRTRDIKAHPDYKKFARLRDEVRWASQHLCVTVPWFCWVPVVKKEGGYSWEIDHRMSGIVLLDTVDLDARRYRPSMTVLREDTGPVTPGQVLGPDVLFTLKEVENGMVVHYIDVMEMTFKDGKE